MSAREIFSSRNPYFAVSVVAPGRPVGRLIEVL